jgi:hypothetical protein
MKGFLQMSTLLLLASGGSGDALSSYIYAKEQANGFDRVVIATTIWERTIFDSSRGPRTLEALADIVYEGNLRRISKDTKVLTGYTPLIQLSNSISFPIYFLDLSCGVRGLRKQIEEIVSCEQISEIWLIDTGGDILSSGDEAGLLSPTLDACFLSSLLQLEIMTKCIVLGSNLDGELTKSEFLERVRHVDFSPFDWITSVNAIGYLKEFSWWPTEAPLLTLHACMGKRGTVLNDPTGNLLHLNELSTKAFVGLAENVTRYSSFHQELAHTNTLNEVRSVIFKYTHLDEMNKDNLIEPLESNAEEIINLEKLISTFEEKKMIYMTIRAACKILKLQNFNDRQSLLSQIADSSVLFLDNPLIQHSRA